MPRKIKRTENEQKRVFLKCVAGGSSIALSCRASGLGRTFIYKERKLKTKFGEQIELAIESRIIVVEDALLKNAKKGNIIAQIFWLKNRGKGKWSDKQELDVKVPDVIRVKAFIQAGEEPVIKEEEPEKIEEKETTITLKEVEEEDPKEIETVL